MVKELQAAPVAVIALLFLALVLFLGAATLTGIKDTQFTTDGRTVINESVTGNVTLAEAVNKLELSNNIANTTVRAENTSAVLTQGTQYEVFPNGTFRILVPTNDVNVSYNYTNLVETQSFNATRSGLDGLNTFSDFQSTLAVVLALVIVVGLIFGGLLAVAISRRGR